MKIVYVHLGLILKSMGLVIKMNLFKENKKKHKNWSLKKFSRNA